MKQIRKKKGFTLVELMAVLLIVALLAGLAAKSFMGQTEKAKVIATKADLKTLHAAVNMFKLDTGRYPSEDMGLIELVEEPTDVTGWNPEGYLESTEVPQDAWDNDFIYMLNPESGKPFVIISYGADGKEGGEENTPDWDLWSTDVK
jgi:general secretion pathway protein G